MVKLTKTEKVCSADSNLTFNIKSVEAEAPDLKEALFAFYSLWEGRNTEIKFIDKNVKEKE